MTSINKPLSPAQEKKAEQVVASLTKSLKLGAKDDAGRKNLARFVNKYARFALKLRGTGPHSHGFDATQRKAIRAAVNEAFGIKAPERKAPAKASGTKTNTANKGKRSTRKSTAQLAKEQSARAAQVPAS